MKDCGFFDDSDQVFILSAARRDHFTTYSLMQSWLADTELLLFVTGLAHFQRFKAWLLSKIHD